MIALRAGASRVRTWIAVTAAAFVVAALLAVPAGTLAASTQLSNPTVTPTGGTTGTTFTFGVTYTNHEGSGAPNEVSVVIDGVKHAMVAGGSDWKAGVRFTYSTTLPAGNLSIVFHSVGRGRFTYDLPSGSVSVNPAPTPAPTPGPTPRRPPSPPPSTAPSSPPSGPSSTPRPATGGPAAGSTSGGGSSGSGSSGSAASGSGVTRPFGDGRSDVGRYGGPRRSAVSRFVAPQGDPSPSRGDHAGGPANPDYAGAGWGDLALYLKALSWGGSATRTMPLLPSIIFTVGTMAILMAFMFFGKRRRDGEPPEPDEVLSAAAARGTGQAATARLVPGIPEDEVGLPRWRRPSLLEARKMDPARTGVAVAQPLSFSRSPVSGEGRERRYIRYHLVGLLDAPDEFRGNEIGELARDDEVELLERSGTYWRVLCPDGREGWIHKMTLGDVVGAPASPTPAEAWSNTRPWDDMENGVLTAFMASRGRV